MKRLKMSRDTIIECKWLSHDVPVDVKVLHSDPGNSTRPSAFHHDLMPWIFAIPSSNISSLNSQTDHERADEFFLLL